MQILSKFTAESQALSGLPNMYSSARPNWIPFARRSSEEKFLHQSNSACCAACGQALKDKEKLLGSLSHGAKKLGIEVLSIRAAWRRRLLLQWDAIQLVSCDAKYINVHDADGSVHLIECALDRVCEQAGSNLVRVHRAHAINPKYLSSVLSRNDGTCDFVMQSGLSVPGSRRLAGPARNTIFGETPRRRSADRLVTKNQLLVPSEKS